MRLTNVQWCSRAIQCLAFCPLQWRHNGRDGVSNHQSQPFIQGADQRKHQSSASLAFVWGIHRWPVNSPHKGPVKMFPFDDVIMVEIISKGHLIARPHGDSMTSKSDWILTFVVALLCTISRYIRSRYIKNLQHDLGLCHVYGRTLPGIILGIFLSSILTNLINRCRKMVWNANRCSLISKVWTEKEVEVIWSRNVTMTS